LERLRMRSLTISHPNLPSILPWELELQGEFNPSGGVKFNFVFFDSSRTGDYVVSKSAGKTKAGSRGTKKGR